MPIFHVVALKMIAAKLFVAGRAFSPVEKLKISCAAGVNHSQGSWNEWLFPARLSKAKGINILYSGECFMVDSKGDLQQLLLDSAIE